MLSIAVCSPDYGDRRLVTFDTTPPMPTYLVAFIVSELQKVPTSNPNINVYVRPDAVPHAALAADLAPKILAELESFTGVPYALPKLDLVGIPDFYFGAMENWGLVTFRCAPLLLVDTIVLVCFSRLYSPAMNCIIPLTERTACCTPREAPPASTRYSSPR